MNLVALLRILDSIQYDDSVSGPLLAPRRITPLAISPLPPAHRNGLIAVGVASLLSAITTVGLFIFITYRLIFWRKYHTTYIGYNQYIILIYNLLLADLQVALGFLLSLHWVAVDSIHSTSRVCPVQGWLLQIGDPSSGLFVLAIAVHTFATVLLGRKPSHRVLVWSVIGLWGFCLTLVMVPTIRHGEHTYVPSGAWCWIDERFDAERLWAHYFWIFVSEFGSLVIYAILFIYLRRKVVTSAAMGRGQMENIKRLRRVTGYMVIYPLAYVVLSLPLAAGRMTMARGKQVPSVTYFCAAGAIIASSGFVDVILYTLTRKALLLDTENTRSNRNHYGSNHASHHIATVTADHRKSNRHEMRMLSRLAANGNATSRGASSTDDIVQALENSGLGRVYQKTTIEITHERFSSERTSTPSDTANNVESTTSPISHPAYAWNPQWD
ncbi:hypothetical protein FQN57_002887 [Myotisia sp. PD_48]|nr:hypothetical protein FQN57_002887 [Myotisia sp. PD_48]